MSSMSAGDVVLAIGALLASGAAELASASPFARGVGRRFGARGATDNARGVLEQRRRAEFEVDDALSRLAAPSTSSRSEPA